MKVRRTGELIAPSEADTATSAYSSHTECSPANACAASPAEVAGLQLVITSTSLRRSTVSAMAPPSSPIATVGITCATPMAPTAHGEPVMSYTLQRHRVHGQRSAHGRQRRPGPQPPEGRRLPQRPDVGQQPSPSCHGHLAPRPPYHPAVASLLARRIVSPPNSV